MSRVRVLFQGSHKSVHGRHDTAQQLGVAKLIAHALGKSLIRAGVDIILTGCRSLDEIIGKSATAGCQKLGIDPRDRLRTYPHGVATSEVVGFGMVLEPMDKRWQEIRTFLIQESDAVIALLGGKGTSDCIQKAVLAKKPVFPIPLAGGGAQTEWERLKKAKYFNREPGDLDYLGDRSLKPSYLADRIAEDCLRLSIQQGRIFSRRIFIVHGHDVGLKNELARFLERLDLVPVILHEQPDRGQDIFSKLRHELSDVGFAFVLLTPDDVGTSASSQQVPNPRARQNVIFEHGLLIGSLGPDRVCAVLKPSVEIPSDLHGILYKSIPSGSGLASIALELVKELKTAGYTIDANRL